MWVPIWIVFYYPYMLAWIVFYYPSCWGARKLEKMNTGVNKVSLTKNDSVKGSHAVGS